MKRIKRRSFIQGAAATAAIAEAKEAQAQFLLGTPISPPPPPITDYVLVQNGNSQALIQVLSPAIANVKTEIAGGGPVPPANSVPGPVYAYWINGAQFDWSLDQTGVTPLPGSSITSVQTNGYLWHTQSQWRISFSATPANAAGEAVTVIQVDAAGSSPTPITLAQAKALAPQLFVDYSAGDCPFILESLWNTGIPIAVTISSTVYTTVTYTPVSWPASTGSNYTLFWSANSPGVYISSPTDPVCATPIPATGGWSAQTINAHIPSGATGCSGTGEIIVVDGTTVHNFGNFSRTNDNNATASTYGAEDVTLGDGFGTSSPFLTAGTNAIGSSELAGMIRKAETDQGRIIHALALRCDKATTTTGFVAPAISGNGTAGSGLFKCGQRLAIPRDTVMPVGLSAIGQLVFCALQIYGAFVTDTTTGTYGFLANPNDYDSGTITALTADMVIIIPLLQLVAFTG
jgi:hypothetical protein